VGDRDQEEAPKWLSKRISRVQRTSYPSLHDSRRHPAYKRNPGSLFDYSQDIGRLLTRDIRLIFDYF